MGAAASSFAEELGIDGDNALTRFAGQMASPLAGLLSNAERVITGKQGGLSKLLSQITGGGGGDGEAGGPHEITGRLTLVNLEQAIASIFPTNSGDPSSSSGVQTNNDSSKATGN